MHIFPFFLFKSGTDFFKLSTATEILFFNFNDSHCNTCISPTLFTVRIIIYACFGTVLILGGRLFLVFVEMFSKEIGA